MRRIRFIYLCGTLLLVGLFTTELKGQHQEIFQNELKKLKERYDFDNWEPETEKVISGVAISAETLPQLSKLRKVWAEDNYSIVEKQDSSYATIRQWWRLEENEFHAFMVVGPSLTSMKDFLILTYLETQRMEPLIKPPGKSIGLDIGHICFVTYDDKEGESLSSVDFIRHNVLIMLRAEGDVRKDLRNIAVKLDTLLKQNKEVTIYEQLPDIPRIVSFSTRKPSINMGETSLLDLQVSNVQDHELRYFWRLTGGGVKKDLEDNFVYYGGETGLQKITVTTMNDLGLHDSKTIEIEVK